MSYTRPIFVVGHRYRVRKSFVSGGRFRFSVGEVVRFQRDAYSPYDNCFVYVFSSELDGAEKEWWLNEEQAPEIWQDYFEPLGPG
jgi:hypothetical protein